METSNLKKNQLKNKFNILIFFILLLSINNEINSFDAFKAFNLNSNDLLLITDEGIILFNIKYNNQTLLIHNVTNKENFGLEFISFAQFPEEQGGFIICRQQEYIYFLSEDATNCIWL